jgi:ribosomal protein S18 acetylase RimI-like enzyme
MMSAMSIVVRPATESDVDAIARYNAAMALESEHRELDPRTVRRGVHAALLDPSLGRYFVADEGGEVVGQLLITHEWSDWRNALFWWIQSVYVVPAARRRGVFRALLDHVRRLADADPGVCGLRLYVERDNVRAQETYRRTGLVDTGYLVMETDRSGAARRARSS